MNEKDKSYILNYAKALRLRGMSANDAMPLIWYVAQKENLRVMVGYVNSLCLSIFGCDYREVLPSTPPGCRIVENPNGGEPCWVFEPTKADEGIPAAH
jgi:hypothetical protein